MNNANNLSSIVSFLNEYLKINEIKDDSWNGLQFEGKSKVKKIVFAVDASNDTFNKAIEKNADMIVVHHGHFWRTSNPSVTEWGKKRLDILNFGNISLYACHLPLDRHAVVGNNAQLLTILGAKVEEEFSLYEGSNIGWIGSVKKTYLTEIEKTLNKALNTKCVVLPFGKELVEKIAVCSGGGGYARFFEALNKRVDLYLTGDQVSVYSTAKDAMFNVIFAGHYATETVGVKALSEIISKQFKIETEFIDIPTGL